MALTVRTSTYSASEVISLDQRAPLQGALPIADMVFRHSVKQKDFGGAGLYAVFFDSRLLYIGKFLGRRSDFLSGNVVEARWTKHLGTFTMRARDIGFSARAFSEIAVYLEKAKADVPDAILQGFRQAKRELICRETGCMSTFSRFLVASSLWAETSGQPKLDMFQFVYTKVGTDLPTEDVREIVSAAEARVLGSIHPPGNTISRRRNTTLLSAVELKERFEQTLLVLGTGEHRALHGQQTESKFINPDLNEPEEAGAASIFVEQLASAPDAIRKFVSALIRAFEIVDDGDIEYTKSPDMRIRRIGQFPRGFLNVATFDWQKNSKRLLLRTLMSDADLARFGLRIDRRGSKRLAHETFLSVGFLENHLDEAINALMFAYASAKLR
jgi:hypothetical protein